MRILGFGELNLGNSLAVTLRSGLLVSSQGAIRSRDRRSDSFACE